MLIGARSMGATDAKSYDVQDYVGWTDAEVEDLLAKCVKEGY